MPEHGHHPPYYSSRNPQQQSGDHAPCTSNHARPPLAIEEEISKGLADVANGRAALERDPKALDMEQVRLRKLWNSSLPINRLPNELLVTIFILYDKNCYADPHGSRIRRSNLLRVCRYWYDVARACPALWRFVKVGRMFKYLQACLELSATSPLDLVFINDLFPKKYLRLLRPHSHRIKELAITSMPDAWQPEVIDLLSREMPALVAIKIHSLEPTFETRTTSGVRLFSSTPGHYPQLRSLSLTHTAAPQNKTIYSQLRSLSLTACSCDFTYVQFVDLISTCAYLEELRLSYFFDRLDAPPRPQSLPPISLKHLRILELLHSPHHECSRFLSWFIVPSSARIVMLSNMPIWHPDYGTASGLFPLFLPSQTSVHLPIIPNTTSVTLKGPFPATTSLTAAVDPKTVECGSMTLTNHVSFAMSANLLGINALAISTIFRDVPLTHLKFNIGLGIIADREMWKDLFTAFPALESLEMDPGWPLTQLMWSALTPNEGSGVLIPLPKLRHVVVNGLSWNGDPASEDFFDDIVATLRARAVLGVRLETLVLDATYPNDEHAKAVQEGFKSKYTKDLQSLVADVTYLLP